MRKIALGLATAAVVWATPALAKDGAVYAGLDFGALAANDTDINVNGLEDAIVIDHDYGFDSGLFLGYDLGSFRIEAEVAYKEARIDEYDSALLLPGNQPPGVYTAGGGKTKVMSYMLNGQFDFGNEDGISGFIGAGAGLASVDLDNFRAFANGPTFLDDKDSGFAWQLMAGVRQAISDNVDVEVKYRYFNANSIDWDDGIDVGDGGFSSHSVMGGIVFNFGGDEPPPPPPPPPPRVTPPPPPPPPPPQTRTCPNGQVVPVSQACPAPPPPPVPPTGERG